MIVRDILLTQKRLMTKDKTPIVSRMLYDTTREDPKNSENLKEEGKVVYDRIGLSIATCVFSRATSHSRTRLRVTFAFNDMEYYLTKYLDRYVNRA